MKVVSNDECSSRGELGNPRPSKADILKRLDELGEIAEARKAASSSIVFGSRGGAGIEYMTSNERAERHLLILQLPSYAQEREAARARIAQRIQQRRLLREEKQDALADQFPA